VDPDPFNLIVFTNHPFHYASADQPAPAPEAISVFGRNPRYPVNCSDALTAIHDSAMKFGNVPQQFEDAN